MNIRTKNNKIEKLTFFTSSCHMIYNLAKVYKLHTKQMTNSTAYTATISVSIRFIILHFNNILINMKKNDS